MIGLPLPARVVSEAVKAGGDRVAALRGVPLPETDTGISVVMTGGIFGTKEDFRELLSLLALAGYQGWAYDYPGQLDAAMTDRDYTAGRLAEGLADVLHAVCPGQAVHVIGHCFGGFVTRAAVLAEPGLARTLTLLGCGPSMRERKHAKMLSGLATMEERGGPMLLWPVVRRLLAENDTVMREFWHTKLATMNARFVTDGALSMADERDRTDELAAAGIPLLVVRGSRDRSLWRPGAYEDMAERLGAGYAVIERAAHSPNMEQPAATAAVLRDFWAACGGRRSAGHERGASPVVAR